ncbi:MAG: C-terminal binding protein [Pseudomonadota bacterium]
MRILIIDPQFDADPDVERAVLGPEADIVVWRTLDRGFPPEAEFAACDGLINCRSRNAIQRKTVAHMEKCRIVSQAGVGFNHIDIRACAERGIPVCNAPDYGTAEVADHAVTLAMCLTRGIVAYDAKLRAGETGWNAREQKTVRRATGMVFGVFGLGRIGTAAALRARAFGMEVAFFDPYLAPGIEKAFGFTRADTLAELMATSDILSVHTPLTTETTRIIDAESLSAAKPGLVLVNTARGGTMDLDAVEAALREGRLGGAGLDVLPKEPIDYAHPLLAAFRANEAWLDGRLILTPHAAFYSPDALIEMRSIAAQNIVDYFERGVLRSCVNAELLGNIDLRRGASVAETAADARKDSAKDAAKDAAARA